MKDGPKKPISKEAFKKILLARQVTKRLKEEEDRAAKAEKKNRPTPRRAIRIMLARARLA